MGIRTLWPFGRGSRLEPGNGDVEAAGLDAEANTGLAEELRVRRAEIARMEELALRETQALELQRADLDRRTRSIDDRQRNVEQQSDELKSARRVQRRELERIGGLSAEEAKELVVAEVRDAARSQAGLELRRIEQETKLEADSRARSILAAAIQRLAAPEASESTTRLIALPTEEMKGRIIGREGRNIRALENLTGVDIIVDDTPLAVVVSSFDGVRREIARVTLERLIADGRIHPALCEEIYERTRDEVNSSVIKAGETAAIDAGVSAVDPGLLEVLGRLKYRTSYGQNVLAHLVEASHLGAMLAHELGASVPTTRRAALLHDLGKAVSHEVEGSHASVGAALARRHGEKDAVVHAIEAHHNEVDPRTVEAVLVRAADSISGARPGARGESLEHYATRMRELEELASRHDGVEKVFAIRAGREVRVIVDPGTVDDEQAALISHEVAAAVEKETEHPGRVKITVIRESRSTAYAD